MPTPAKLISQLGYTFVYLSLGAGILNLVLGNGNLAVAQRVFGGRPLFFERGDAQFEAEIERLQEQPPEDNLILEEHSDHDSMWQQFVSREGNFSIWLPEGIFSEDERLVETDRFTIPFQLIVSDRPPNRFIVAYSKILSGESTENPEELFRLISERFNQNTEFATIAERSFIEGELTARETTFQNQTTGEFITSRFYLVGDRLYILALLQNSNNEQLAENFFETFELLNPQNPS